MNNLLWGGEALGERSLCIRTDLYLKFLLMTFMFCLLSGGQALTAQLAVRDSFFVLGSLCLYFPRDTRSEVWLG